MNFPFFFLIEKNFLQPILLTKCPEMIFNKIEKKIKKTYTGLKSLIQRFQICFSQNLSCMGVEYTS